MARLIDLDEAHKRIIKYVCENICDEPRGCSYCRASDAVDALYEVPTVDAEPVRHGYDTGEGRLFHCSICGYDVFDIFEHNENEYVYETGKKWNYCPNCGAKMDGGDS